MGDSLGVHEVAIHQPLLCVLQASQVRTVAASELGYSTPWSQWHAIHT